MADGRKWNSIWVRMQLDAIKWKNNAAASNTKMYFYWAIAPISCLSRRIIKWKQENLCNVYTFYFTTNTWRNRKKVSLQTNCHVFCIATSLLPITWIYPTSVFYSVCRHPIWFKIGAHTVCDILYTSNLTTIQFDNDRLTICSIFFCNVHKNNPSFKFGSMNWFASMWLQIATFQNDKIRIFPLPSSIGMFVWIASFPPIAI